MRRNIIVGVGAGLLVVAAGFGWWATHRQHANTVVQRPTQGVYVALGDSVAAGIGLQPYSDSSACDRTDASYPNLMAKSYNYSLVNLACGGASIPEGIIGKQDVNKLMVTPQLEQLLNQKDVKYISLTIGANDMLWTQFLGECYTSACGTPADMAREQTLLASTKANLTAIFDRIGNRYGPNVPQFVVTGYHQALPTSPVAGCSDIAGWDTHELAWGRQFLTDLNTTIRDVAEQYNFTVFVPIDFTGHELCTSDPWVQGLNDKEPYHPTAAGQQAYSDQIQTTFSNHK